MNETRPVLLAAAAFGALMLGGCGGADRAEPDGVRKSAHRASDVEIKDFEFRPGVVRVERGARVRFQNSDAASHTATSDRNGVFDSKRLERGQGATVTFSRAGTFSYHCDFHPLMKGKVSVR